MLQYDLVALGWQITILVIFGGTVWFLTNRKNYLVSVDELEKHFMNRITSVEGNTINYCDRSIEEALKKCDDVFAEEQQFRTDLQMDLITHIKQVASNVSKFEAKIADHQKDITALKTQKALS